MDLVGEHITGLGGGYPPSKIPSKIDNTKKKNRQDLKEKSFDSRQTVTKKDKIRGKGSKSPNITT